MPRCEGCKKDVKQIVDYKKTGQWLCEACVASHEKPPEQKPSQPSSPPKERDNRQEAES